MRFTAGSSHTQTTQNTSGVVFNLNNENSSNTGAARQKLAAADCIESSEWIDDQANWLENQNAVISKMRSFYEMTGVQPYLIIADQVNGKKDYTEADVERYLRNRYDELFADDGHLILFFCEAYENEYDPYLLIGSKAATVIDTDGVSEYGSSGGPSGGYSGGSSYEHPQKSVGRLNVEHSIM